MSSNVVQILMPQLGESVVEGTIVRWVAREGEPVERDQTLLEVETDKALVEVPSPASGMLGKISVQEGATVEVGVELGEIHGAEALPKKQPRSRKHKEAASSPRAVIASTRVSAVAPPRRGAGGRLSNSPLVRRLAREYGVDLALVRGSGGGGRITKDDVLRHVRDGAAQSGDAEIVTWSRRRKLIADHMVSSVLTSPHAACVAEVDLHAMARWRSENKGVSYTAIIAKATCQALGERECRQVNATVSGQSTLVHNKIHLGVAVNAQEGLIVPVVHDAHEKSIDDLAASIADITRRAREGKARPDELQGGTFTITNLGPRGNLFGTAILNQPQVAILRAGEIVKRPVVIEDKGGDEIVVRPIMMLCLSYDHRVVDGAMANHFLRRIKEVLEQGSLR